MDSIVASNMEDWGSIMYTHTHRVVDAKFVKVCLIILVFDILYINFCGDDLSKNYYHLSCVCMHGKRMH